MSDQGNFSGGNHSVEETVRAFYDNYGWVETAGKLGEDASFREFRGPYYPYHEGSVQRTHACFAGFGGTLLLAGSGDVPDSHVAIARQFRDVWCLDISGKALEIAKRRLGSNARYVLGSILDIPPSVRLVDAVFCAHVLYHIDINNQQRAIEELIRVTKPGGRVVVLYKNSKSIIRKIIRVKDGLRRRLVPGATSSQPDPLTAGDAPMRLPFALHPIEWWRQFEPQCKVTILPWDIMSNKQERTLIGSDGAASLVYAAAGLVERVMPRAAARWWHYQIVILDKAAR